MGTSGQRQTGVWSVCGREQPLSGLASSRPCAHFPFSPTSPHSSYTVKPTSCSRLTNHIKQKISPGRVRAGGLAVGWSGLSLRLGPCKAWGVLRVSRSLTDRSVPPGPDLTEPTVRASDGSVSPASGAVSGAWAQSSLSRTWEPRGPVKELSPDPFPARSPLGLPQRAPGGRMAPLECG